jgi:hypothetical protein
MARLSNSATASGTKVEKKEVSAEPSSTVSIVYRFNEFALRPEPPHDQPRTRRPSREMYTRTDPQELGDWY